MSMLVVTPFIWSADPDNLVFMTVQQPDPAGPSLPHALVGVVVGVAICVILLALLFWRKDKQLLSKDNLAKPRNHGKTVDKDCWLKLFFFFFLFYWWNHQSFLYADFVIVA